MCGAAAAEKERDRVACVYVCVRVCLYGNQLPRLLSLSPSHLKPDSEHHQLINGTQMTPKKGERDRERERAREWDLITAMRTTFGGCLLAVIDTLIIATYRIIMLCQYHVASQHLPHLQHFPASWAQRKILPCTTCFS